MKGWAFWQLLSVRRARVHHGYKARNFYRKKEERRVWQTGTRSAGLLPENILLRLFNSGEEETICDWPIMQWRAYAVSLCSDARAGGVSLRPFD